MMLAEITPGLAVDPATAFWIAAPVLLPIFVFYLWLARRVSAKSELTTQPFGIPDALCAGILALWMLSVIQSSLNKTQSITMQAILGNSVVYGAVVLGIFGVIGFQKNSGVSIFGMQPGRLPGAASKGLLWLIVTYPLILAVQAIVQRVFGTADDSQQIVRYFLEHPGFKHRAAVIFMAVIVAPVAEEVIFRGYFYGVIRRYGGRIPAILTSSLLFAAIHVHIPSIPGLALLAVILCLLYERTATLWAPITMHALFNASTIAILLIWPEMAG